MDTETGKNHRIGFTMINLTLSYFNNFFEIMWIINTFVTIRQIPELKGGPK